MRVVNLFWGTIIIFLGFLFFFSTLGILRVDWWFLFKFWPVLIIITGIYFLPNTIKKISTFLFSIVIVSLLFYAIDFRNLAGYGDETFIRAHEKPLAPFDFADYQTRLSFDYKPDFKNGRLKFSVNGGNYRVSKSNDKLFTLKAEENVWRSFRMDQSQGGDTGIANLALSGAKTSKKSENPFTIKLHEDPVWQLKFNLGHSKGRLDFSPFNIEKLAVSALKADLSIKLGDLMNNTMVKLVTPGSRLTLTIPEKATAKVVSNKAIAKKDLEGFESINPFNHVTSLDKENDHQLTIQIQEPPQHLSIERE